MVAIEETKLLAEKIKVRMSIEMRCYLCTTGIDSGVKSVHSLSDNACIRFALTGRLTFYFIQLAVLFLGIAAMLYR